MLFKYSHIVTIEPQKKDTKYIRSVSERLWRVKQKKKEKLKEELLVKLIYITYIICYCCSIL